MLLDSPRDALGPFYTNNIKANKFQFRGEHRSASPLVHKNEAKKPGTKRVRYPKAMNPLYSCFYGKLPVKCDMYNLWPVKINNMPLLMNDTLYPQHISLICIFIAPQPME